MKGEKARITKLISAITEKFPAGEDIYGYEGMTKEKVVDVLNETYQMISRLEEFIDRAEVVWIRRYHAKQFEEISSLMKDFDTSGWKDKFDQFLERITKLRVNTRMLYLTIINDPIRPELQIKEAAESAAMLKESIALSNSRVTMISELTELVKKLSGEVQSTRDAVVQQGEDTKKWSNAVQGLNSSVSAKSKLANAHEAELVKILDSSREATQKVLDQSKQVSSVLEKLEAGAKKFVTDQTTLENQLKTDSTIQESIRQTLQDVNKHGMAGAFKKRKDELRLTVGIWGTLSVISIGALIAISYFIASDIFATASFDPVKNLFKIPTAVACVWLCWFCGKQFGYSIRIREDYSFKYAISMAFEGYKNETREINPELLETLLKMTVANISVNPVSIYDTRSNHGSPWHEVAEGIRSFFKVQVKAEAKVDSADLPKI